MCLQLLMKSVCGENSPQFLRAKEKICAVVEGLIYNQLRKQNCLSFPTWGEGGVAKLWWPS